MNKNNFYRKLFAWHAWLGLALGLIYLVVSVSGATIVFVNELTKWRYADQVKVSQPCGKDKISYDKLYAIAREQYPHLQYHVVGHNSLGEGTASFAAGVKPHLKKLFKPGLDYDIAYVDPYAEKIIFRSDSHGHGDFFHWLIELHASLLAGAAGEFFVCLLAVAMLGSLITGTLIYRKALWRTLTFRPRLKWKSWRMVVSNLHRLVGTWALLINICIFFSGFYLYKQYWTTAWWNTYSVAGVPFKNMDAHKVNPIPGVSLDSLVQVSLKKVPELHIESIAIENDSNVAINVVGKSCYKLFGDYDNYIFVNFDRKGQLTSIENKKWNDLGFSEKFDNINWSILHTGWALGLPGKIIWCCMGFCPCLLSLTGFMMWWRKK